ncbi:secreted protein [Phakopsora pachyrhizi]|uniref:Secreted protein n=1 Tax=Phakopsora pachyrhizi TaxID=170000 RepID=A0AAV0AV29_PHAPC|nr:secreted protein [Phakopsora pachyrhizi]CAH7673753.1 secreted protein [Phakopsora pachyrhizi]CAH7674200.1 secreted protein [Phakopsora pachyrhizi]
MFLKLLITLFLGFQSFKVGISTQTKDPNDPNNNIFSHSENAASAQLRNDAHRVIESFSDAMLKFHSFNSSDESTEESARLFQEIVKGAMSYHLDQGLSNMTNSTEAKLDSMGRTINYTLNSINDVTDKLLSSTNGALKFADLRRCLLRLVDQGGLLDGQTCVVNGMSISGVSEILKSVLADYGGGIIPENVLLLTSHTFKKKVGYLIKGGDSLSETIDNALTSVKHSIAGELVQALDDAFQCFKKAIFLKTSHINLLEETRKCNRDAANKSSVFRDLKTLYLSIVNQFVGYAIPNVLDSVHRISDKYLAGNRTALPEEHFFRKIISRSVRSIVASNSGNQATMAYKIADCLDFVVGTSDPEAAASKAAAKGCLQRPDGPRVSIKEIVYGYIQQIYSVLPVEISAKIEYKKILSLNRNSTDYQEKVENIHKEFLKTDVGPEYVTCYERFLDCLFDTRSGGVLVRPKDSKVTCFLGKACQKTPDGKQNPISHL